MKYSMAGLCALFGVSKQAYYQHNDDAALAKASREEFALQYAMRVREKDGGIGGEKMWEMYRREFANDRPIGRDRFCNIIDANGLKLRRRTRRPRTTDSTHGLPVYPDMVRDFIPTGPNQLWVSDITYITILNESETSYSHCYLSMILDSYSKEIIGWKVGASLETSNSISALKMAMKRIRGRNGLRPIHHSDRGCQYASSEYVRLLKANGIRISMTETGDPKDNAQAERINNTMKNELLFGRRFHSLEQVTDAVSKAVNFYNNERPHMSINMMTPVQAASCSGEINKRW
ncbi:MAG: IS3 family transposase, partial [Bacteroidales bacterium]|nr:IS3 family transposase [Bacteroidales bacterium]